MKNFKKILVPFIGFVTLFFPLVTFAQVPQTSPPTQITIPNPLKQGVGDTLLGLLEAILKNIVMPIAAVAVVVYIVYAGFTFVTAQGNPAKISAAKQRLLWALVGAGILLGAAAISGVLKNTICLVLPGSVCP